MKNVIFIFLLFLCTTCTTYDSALIYHKNFSPGKNDMLRFNGFYSDSMDNLIDADDQSVKQDYLFKPVFFYSNGSAFSTNNYTRASLINEYLKTNRLPGSWGNYLIHGDTIQLEKFQLVDNNYERIILKGILSKNQIHWISRKEHNASAEPVDYSIFFKPSSIKPDSTQNFTRTKKKYNQ